MKKIHFLILFVFISNIVLAQNNNFTEEELVKKVIIGSFDEIWSKLSPENIVHYYTTDFLLLENGEVWNNDTIRKYLNTARKDEVISKRVNNFDFIEVVVAGNFSWVAYHNYATFTIKNQIVRKAHWLESAVAIKTKNGWKLQMLHSTRIDNK